MNSLVDPNSQPRLIRMQIPKPFINYESKVIELRKRLRSKNQEIYRLSSTNYEIHKFSSFIPETVPISPQLLQLLGIPQASSPQVILIEILQSIKSGKHCEPCLDYVNSMLSSENPPFMTILSSGVLRELMTIFISSADGQVLTKTAMCLCNFAFGMKDCSEALRKLDALMIFMKKIDSQLGAETISVIVKSIGNILDCFSAVHEFLLLGGLGKILDKIGCWSKHLQILREVGFLCAVICEFIEDCADSEIKQLIQLIEVVSESPDQEIKNYSLYVIEILSEKVENSTESITPRLLLIVIDSLLSDNNSEVLRSLQIIGNTACRRSAALSLVLCSKIFDTIPLDNLNAKIRQKTLWMLRCLIVNPAIIDVLYYHRIYQQVGMLLSDPVFKVRKQAVKYFHQLYSSQYFYYIAFAAPVSIMNEIDDGINTCEDMKTILSYLQLIETVLSLKIHDYTIQSLESSQLLNKIETLVYHKNAEIRETSMYILQLLQDRIFPYD